MEKKYVVVSGNPFDGLTIYGPFPYVEDAIEWADSDLRDEPWWIVKVQSSDRSVA